MSLENSANKSEIVCARENNQNHINRATISPPAKRDLNGVFLEGRWYPEIVNRSGKTLQQIEKDDSPVMFYLVHALYGVFYLQCTFMSSQIPDI